MSWGARDAGIGTSRRYLFGFGTLRPTKETSDRQRLQISRKESVRAAARHFPGIELAVIFGRQVLCEFETKIPAHLDFCGRRTAFHANDIVRLLRELSRLTRECYQSDRSSFL
jgi:hypothetical protein